MHHLHKLIGVMLCAIFLVLPIRAFAEDADDPYDEPETEQATTVPVPETTTPEPDTTVPSRTVITAYTPTVTATQPQPVDPPLVRITRENLSRVPKAGETFVMTVVFRNYSSDVFLRQGLASFEPSEGLTVEENASSKVVPVVDAGGLRSVQIRLRVAKDAAKADQSVSVNYVFGYETPDGLIQATATEKLLVTVEPAASATEKTSSASATPNIIVRDYNYGGTVTAGDAFTLRLSFENTSQKLDTENIVMSVEVGEGLAITSASNTYYYASLGAGKTMSQSIPMRVAANADPAGARIDISFRYEYVDNGTRADASASERLSIPIYIPDRFTVSAPDMDLIGVQNEELSVSLPYVNKSRVEIANVSAELLYDDATVYCEQPRVNLGNFEPGTSGTIDFYFTPLEAGSGEVTVRVTYEDELMQEKHLEIRVPYSADASFFDPGMDEPFEEYPEETSGSCWWLRIAIAAAAAAVLALIVVLIVRRRKKKKAADPAIDFDWGSPQEVKTHEDR